MPDYQGIRAGRYSAAYFNRAKNILEAEGMTDTVLMQIFQKQDAILCGVDETLDVLKHCATNWSDLTVHTLSDGAYVKPWETVMTIEGPLQAFVHLESVYLGILRDSTTVATNMQNLVLAANGRDVLYLADRFNGFENQERQGHAAIVGGAAGVCTDSMCVRDGGSPVGTMAHALIAAFGGSVVAASRAFAKHYPGVPLIVLVDFNNNCVADSLAVAEALGKDLKAVRLDTSEKMQDQSFWVDGVEQDDKDLFGVNPQLVKNVRTALNDAGRHDVKIVVSGGFSADKIRTFEARGIPVDLYGVGSSVLHGGSDFTADIVFPVGKAGRPLRPNKQLKLVS